MGFDAATQAAGSDAECDPVDVGQVDREERNVTAIGYVNDVQSAAGGIAGGGGGHGSVGRAKLSLFVARGENVGGGGRELGNIGCTAICVAGIEDVEEIVGIRVSIKRGGEDARTTGE